MSSQLPVARQIILDRPPARRSLLRYLMILAALLSVGGAVWAWQARYRPPFLAAEGSEIGLHLVEVDQGDVIECVVENGTLESATNTVVRCEVEASVVSIGGTGGTSRTTGPSRRRGSTVNSGSGQSGPGTSGTQAGSKLPGGAGTAVGSQETATTKAEAKAGIGKIMGSSGASSPGSSGGSSTGSGSSGSGSSGSSGSSGGSSTASSGTGSGSEKPSIRSFSYTVTPHSPLRGSGAQSTTTTVATIPGTSRIVSILPEGTRVKKGQVVCELDSFAFEDELQAQLVRWLNARSWVDQARAILEVSQISLREYRDGIYPQDLQLIRQYIETCKIEKERSERNASWSRDMYKRGFRTAAQLKADELNDQSATIALEEAEGMLERLANFTGPKNIWTLEAKIKAIESDKKNQEASFQLETQRRDRLQRNIDHCTLRAPADGIVVYMNQLNVWGMMEAQIEEGATVHETQPIFQIPDPRSMRVKARINETKMGQLKTGQKALIKVDAFPERLMPGTVTEITAISTPLNGPFSDVRIYFAMVKIDKGHDALRPGLTAEVFFQCDSHTNVTRVPIQAVRSIDGKHYVALPQPSPSAERSSPWKWQRVELGISDPEFVEVVSGVKRGERVIANSFTLPTPDSIPEEQPRAPAVTNVSMQP